MHVRNPRRRAPQFNGFWEDAEAAMTNNPAYFARWYSVKSWLLVAALAALAYQAGKKGK